MHLQRAVAQTKIPVQANSQLVSLDLAIGSCSIENRLGEQQKISVDNLMICIGRDGQTDILTALPKIVETAQISSANFPGLFFAGDIRRQHDRFIAAALGDGQLAACMARDYLVPVSELENRNGEFLKSKREIFVKVKENKQLRGAVPVYDAQGTVKFDDEIGEKSRFETKTI